MKYGFEHFFVMSKELSFQDERAVKLLPLTTVIFHKVFIESHAIK